MWLEIAVVTLVAAVFTAGAVRFSLLHERLAVAPEYDDVMYLMEALERIDLGHDQGLSALLGDLVTRPPHAPFSTLLAMAGYSVFGRVDWAPYAANGIIVLGMALLVAYLVRGLSFGVKFFCYTLAFTSQLAFHSVLDFRPDLACGLLCAAGAVLAVEQRWTEATLKRRLLIGALFGAALLTKPSALPLTAALLAALPFLTYAQARWSGAGAPRAPGAHARAWLPAWGEAAALSGPYFMTAGGQTLDYILLAFTGPQYTDVNLVHTTLWGQLTLCFTDPTNAHLLRNHLVPFLVLLIAGLVLGLLDLCVGEPGVRAKLLRHAALAGAAALAYAAPTVACIGSPFLAATLHWLMLFWALWLLRDFVVERGPSVRWRRGREVALALWAVLMAATLRWQVAGRGRGILPYARTSSYSERAAQHRQILEGVYAALKEHAGGERVSFYFPTLGVLVPAQPTYWARRDRLPGTWAGECLCYSGDLAEHQRAMAHCDFVLASEPGTGMVNEGLPSARLQKELLAYLGEGRDFRLLASFASPLGPKFHLFERRK